MSVVDLILLAALGVSFYAGFKTHDKFATLGDAWKALMKKLTG